MQLIAKIYKKIICFLFGRLCKKEKNESFAYDSDGEELEDSNGKHLTYD